jgi:hypothetical protein
LSVCCSRLASSCPQSLSSSWSTVVIIDSSQCVTKNTDPSGANLLLLRLDVESVRRHGTLDLAYVVGELLHVNSTVRFSYP